MKVAFLQLMTMTFRQAGFPLGAKQAISGSHFGSGSGEILLDELDCKTGREDGIQECSFDPWKKHDCSEGEWAGVVCKVQQDSCKEDDEFRSGHRIMNLSHFPIKMMI